MRSIRAFHLLDTFIFNGLCHDEMNADKSIVNPKTPCSTDKWAKEVGFERRALHEENVRTARRRRRLLAGAACIPRVFRRIAAASGKPSSDC